jgi:acetyl-CoA synthetase
MDVVIHENWIAPELYNVTSEMEGHASGKMALTWLDESGAQEHLTYGELRSQANRLGHGLRGLGLEKGDRVLVMVPRRVVSYVIYLACLKLGLVIIPTSEMLRAKDLSYRLRHSEARAVIVWPEQAAEMEKGIREAEMPAGTVLISAGDEIPGWTALASVMHDQPEVMEAAPTRREDMAILTYTSGTTGNPKGVVHTHGWGYAHLRITASSWLDIQPEDTVWATAAPGWQKWIWSPFLSVLGMGATGFVYNGRFNAERYLELLQQYRIRALCCTPTEYRLMAKTDRLERYDLSGLRSAVSAGEPLNREVVDVFRRYFDITIRDGYGQTESTLLIGTLKDTPMRIGSMGLATAAGMVEVIDEAGQPLPAGEIGDIGVHRDMPALFDSYYKDPERKPGCMRGDYFVTGDRAKRDEEGYFWFQGRNDDIIISSGYTIGPFEVEDALMKHPAVKECAVVASPDEIRGHVVKAFIVLKDGFGGTEELAVELQRHVKSMTAPYKYPRKIEFIAELPKTISGKVRRVELRELETALRG